MAAVPDRARQAYRILHVGFVVAPPWPGWTGSSTCWSTGTATWPRSPPTCCPSPPHTIMLVVGVVEIALRDFGLSLGALGLALARLAEAFGATGAQRPAAATRQRP